MTFMAANDDQIATYCGGDADDLTLFVTRRYEHLGIRHADFDNNFMQPNLGFVY
jgi:hypothetical protein